MNTSQVTWRRVGESLGGGAFLLAAALVIAAPAAAEPEAGRFELGLDLGAAYLGGEVAGGMERMGQLRAGLLLTRRFELEGQWSRVDAGREADLDRLLLNAVFNFKLRETRQAYVLAGVGRAELDVPGGREKRSSTVQIAAGNRLFLGDSRRVAARIELSLWREQVLDSGSTVNAGITGGLSFRPGIEPVARLGGIGGRVWIDENGDGLAAGEPALAGVAVSLTRGGREAAPPATTDDEGRYGFADLEPGGYRLQFALPAEFGIAPGGSPRDVEVVAGGRLEVEFGALRKASLGLSASYQDGGVDVRVWADRDRDGGYSEDEGLAGIPLLLTRQDGAASREASSGAAGAHHFERCLPGGYQVAIGDAPALDAYYLAPGTSPTMVEVPAPVGLSAIAERDTVSGRVWLDRDADGERDDGEPAIPGARLRLAPQGEAAGDETETGPEGEFRFGDRRAGAHQLSLLDSPALAGIPVLPGTSPRNLAVPRRVALAVGVDRDTVFMRVGIDRDADGRLRRDEPGLEAVGVRLSGAGQPPSDAASRADGRFVWTERLPGTYRVEALPGSLPPGLWLPDEAASRTVRVFAPVGLSAEGLEERVEGRVWLDDDRDRLPGGEEPAVPGAEVALSREQREAGRGETSADGSFAVDGLAAGIYEVAVDPSSLAPGMWPDPATAVQSVEVLPVRNGSIAGAVVWVDKDGAERPLAGQTISLQRADEQLATARTGAGGGYSFTELEPGTYLLRLRFRPAAEAGSPASPLSRTVDVRPGGPTDGSLRLSMVELLPSWWPLWLLAIAALSAALVWLFSRWWKYGNMLAPCFRRWRILRRGQRAALRRDIEAARRGGLGQLEQVSKRLGRVCCADWDIATEFFLAHRGHRAWAEMHAIAAAMSPHLARKPLLRQQRAFALNRDGLGEQAQQVLEELRDQRGPSAETCGLLGRVHKDRWDAARRAGAAEAPQLLEQAIEAYREGHRTEPSNPYPGINMLTLMAFTDTPEAERRSLTETVAGAARSNAEADPDDYWAWATLLELAVHQRDEGEARRALARAVGATDERWQYETTLRNIRLIRSAREARDEATPAWAAEVEQALESAFGGAAG